MSAFPGGPGLGRGTPVDKRGGDSVRALNRRFGGPPPRSGKFEWGAKGVSSRSPNPLPQLFKTAK